MAELELRGCGNSWRVYAGNRPVSRPFAQISTATAAMKGIEKRLRRATAPRRPCLCCGQAFPSEGAHNRLCDPCRRRA
jgi:hypothetical protein